MGRGVEASRIRDSAPGPGAPRDLARELTLPAATALVVGQVVAVGIFLTPGTIIRTLASPVWVLAVWALIGGMAVCGALCYGALAARYPHAGGGYVYLREAFGSRVAFLYGWKCFLIMDPGITAALATGFAAYAAAIVPMGPVALRATAVAAIVALALVHVLGVRPGTRLLITLSVLKIGLVAGLVLVAALSPVGRFDNFLPFVDRRPGAPAFGGALAGALVAAFFAFGGWWEVTKIAGEVRNAPRTVPRALLLGLGAVTLLYVSATLAFMYVIPIEQVGPGEAFVAQVGAVLLGPGGGTVVAGIVLVSVLGSLGAMLMLAPRVYFAMARDGVFPAAAAAVHPRFGTPARAVGAQAGLASVLVLIGTFESIVAYFIFVTVAFIALTVAAVFVIRRRDPAFTVPGHPWTAVAFLGLVAGLLVLLLLNAPVQAGLGVAIVALGVPAYAMLGRAPARRAVARTPESSS
jgi:basic amino acid/polyamine antiporter, APA family